MIQTNNAIRPVEPSDIGWIAALNTSLEVELSPLSKEQVRRLIDAAFYASVANPDDGFLLAFDQAANYASPNFRWFQHRYQRFVYIDRIAVAPHARGRGIGAALYQDLLHTTKATSGERLVCEVNIEPPNPASDAFHTKLGFAEVGRAHLKNRKYVRYLARYV